MMKTENIKILLAEDDINLGTILKEFLQIKNFDVSLAKDGKAAKELFKSGIFDLCILDIMMPKLDGFMLAKIIRSKNKNIPIIFLTAKSMLEDKLQGFEIGADDYITKPFSTEELFLRINAIFKRVNLKSKQINSETAIYNIGKYIFDYDKRILKIRKKEHYLTSKEAELLHLFCININDILSRSTALEAIWTEDNYFTSRSMDVYITKLRKYFRDDSTIQIINIHGKGFKLLA